jgi:polar amino acid transport system permease protein
MIAGYEGTAVQAAILQDIQVAQRNARAAFRLQFLVVWALLIGGLVFALWATRQIDTDWITEWAPYILGGTGDTIRISILSIGLAVVLALFGALGRLATTPVPYAVATLYVSLVRGTPLLAQILFIYLALPQMGVVLDPFLGGVVALGFNYGAYMTEIFRAGIEAVPRGQREAARALGMPESLLMRRIVLPQAIRIVVPAFGNEFIAMIKDSSLLSVVSVTELLWRATRAGRQDFRTMQALFVAMLIYWVLTIGFSFLQERLERRLARSGR